MAKRKPVVVENVVLDVLPEEVKAEVVEVCPNCDDSGMTCNTCGVGKVQG